MNPETNKRFCKKCHILKDRISDGTYPNGRDRKWRDQDGLLWSGNTCGSCNNARLKEVMAHKRVKKEGV